MCQLIEIDPAADPKLVFEFFTYFSRFEYALKRSGYLKNQERAEADWDCYAHSLNGRFTTTGDCEFERKVKNIKLNAPKIQIVKRGKLDWKKSHQNKAESEEQYVLRLIRITRNNLFHGGKYESGPVGVSREKNELLIDAGIVILKQCLVLSGDVNKWFQK